MRLARQSDVNALGRGVGRRAGARLRRMVQIAFTPPARVLVVDDEPLIVAELSDYFTRRGYLVSGATSTRDAERALAETPGFDVAVVDVRMPDEDGPTFIDRVLARRTARERPRVIVISGHTSAEDVLATRGGTFELVAKPLRLATLQARVAAAARERRDEISRLVDQ